MPLLDFPSMRFGAKKLEPFLYPEMAKIIPVQLFNHTDSSVTYYKRGTVFSQLAPATSGASLLYAPYDNAGTDGTQVGKCILVFDTVVSGPIDHTPDPDEAQKYWFGSWTTTPFGVNGETMKSVPMYFGGCFLTSDLMVGAGTAEDTAARLDNTNTDNLVDTLAFLGDINATNIMVTALAADGNPDVFAFRF